MTKFPAGTRKKGGEGELNNPDYFNTPLVIIYNKRSYMNVIFSHDKKPEVIVFCQETS